MRNDILQVRDLKTYFYGSRAAIPAVDGVSFDIERGSVFGLAGESGCGKTLTALSILGLIAPPGRIIGGSVLFDGMSLLDTSAERLRSIRGSRISMVFQEPSAALNPVFTVGYQVVEAILTHRRLDRARAKKLALEYIARVKIPQADKVFHDYPHQLSGGMKQRLCMAMALVNSPELLILDEPTTALDVTVQAQILDLLDDVIKNQRLSILFITHDFGVIARMCDRVAVMSKGRIVETGKTRQVLSDPKDESTIALLESVRALS